MTNQVFVLYRCSHIGALVRVDPTTAFYIGTLVPLYYEQNLDAMHYGVAPRVSDHNMVNLFHAITDGAPYFPNFNSG